MSELFRFNFKTELLFSRISVDDVHVLGVVDTKHGCDKIRMNQTSKSVVRRLFSRFECNQAESNFSIKIISFDVRRQIFTICENHLSEAPEEATTDDEETTRNLFNCVFLLDRRKKSLSLPFCVIFHSLLHSTLDSTSCSIAIASLNVVFHHFPLAHYCQAFFIKSHRVSCSSFSPPFSFLKTQLIMNIRER